MNCIECGAVTQVRRTARGGGPGRKQITIREHACNCGASFSTEQRIIRSLSVIRPQETDVKLSVNQQETGGKPSNNDLSDPISSLTLLEDPDLSKKDITRSDRARAKKQSIDYPDDFSVFWDNIGSTRSKGLKSEALRAWNDVGRPPADELISKWNEYLRSLGDTFPKDVCRWIKLRGWEEHYADNIIRNAPLKTRETHAALSRYLERTEEDGNGP